MKLIFGLLIAYIFAQNNDNFEDNVDDFILEKRIARTAAMPPCVYDKKKKCFSGVGCSKKIRPKCPNLAVDHHHKH